MEFPGGAALRDSALHEQCPLRGMPRCPPASKRYRTHDGTCNNPARPRWGSTLTPVQRLLPPSYADGLQAPRRSVTGVPLPSPRALSAHVHTHRDVEAQTLTHLLMQWGQFVDHDITSTSQSRGFNGSVLRCCKDGGRNFVPKEFLHPECMPIAVSTDDYFYGQFGIRCLEFVRSSPAAREDCALGWREQINQVTGFLDASPVYGNSAKQSDNLRLFRNGMLQYGRVQLRKPILPPELDGKDELCRKGAISSDCFKSGDNRVNEHPGLVAMHIVWLRKHNRMATELAHRNPHWSDEKIYQETRKIVGAMIQHVTYNEFLPIVLGFEVMRLFDLELQRKSYYKDYNRKINPSPANAFSAAAFRFGHSLVQSSLVRYDRFHKPLTNNVSLHDEHSNPSNIWSFGAVDRLLLGMLNQRAQKRDEFITEELTNRLFQTPSAGFGMDLAAINVQRGRDHGVPPYTAWREPCGLKDVREWADLRKIMPTRAVRRMQELYRHIDDIDLFTGGMAERPVIGGLVGPTFACIIAQQFSNIRKGDRFWYENGGFESSFTPAQLQQIRRISLAQVLCTTLDTIDTIQPFAFMTADKERNERISCDSNFISNFDLSPWTELLPKLDNDISDLDKSDPVKRTTPIKSSPDKLSSHSNLTPPKKSGSLKPNRQTSTRKPTMETMTVNEEQNVTEISTNKTNIHKIDDKLDFRNKSRRFADNETFTDNNSSRERHPYNPLFATINYNNNRPYQYDSYPIPINNNDHSFQGSINNQNYNNGQHRPDKPVITVTENLKDFTYLINYVPTTTPSYNNKPHNRDVIKVTYQTYEETYKRPQPSYLNNQHTIPVYHNSKFIQRPKDSTSNHDLNKDDRQHSDFSATKDLDIDIPARSGDHNTFTKVRQSINSQLTDEFDLRRTLTTDSPYKLVTFSHLGTYRHDNKEFPPKYNIMKNDALEQKDIVLTPPETRTKSYLTDNTMTTNFKTLTNTKLAMKLDLTTNKPDTTERPKLTTYFTTPSVIHQSTEHSTTPTTYKTKINKIRPKTTTTLKPGRYYYIGNVLHRYPDSPQTTVTDKTNEQKNKTHILRNNLNNASANGQTNKTTLDNRQTNRVSNFNLTDGHKKEGKIRTVKPQSHVLHRNTNHQIKFDVIPSENSPSQWAVYEENMDLQDGLMQTMPPMNRDPMALEELPRPINLTARYRPKTKKPSRL